MSKSLIIAEKPSVAREFAKMLEINGTNKDGYIEANNYLVTWCVGHLVTMSYPEKYDENLKKWDLSLLPFLPKEYKYEVIQNVKKQFDIVCALLNREDVDKIYVCTDSGREGEYIYRLVDEMAGCPKKDKKRVWIDSQTKEAILKGIKEAKDLSEYNSLSDSAYLRAKEDYLIGINFSRALTVIYGRELAKTIKKDSAVIAVGRVMTCVLGMIVSREREIRNFKKINFYKIQGMFGNDDSTFQADFKCESGSKYFESPKLYNEYGFKTIDDAKEAIEYIKNQQSKPNIFDVSKKSLKENAPLLFNLAELQNECTKRYKISPDQTLEIVQTLYERKLLTYPRTDARVLSTSVAKEISKNLNGIVKGNKEEDIKNILKEMVDNKYSTNILKTKYVNDEKITDHYAIIPTGDGYENYDKLTSLQKDIFNLVTKRFLAIFFPPAVYNKLAITIEYGSEKFYANSKICIENGYLEVYKNVEDVEKKDEKTDNNEVLKGLKKGQEIKVFELNEKEGETSPPSRYTSGSIILAMENAGKLIEDENLREQIKGQGIGTSATRAEIIKKLERIMYISTNAKTQVLTPTMFGEDIYDILKKSIPDMLNPELTASWEKGLAMVANKEIELEDFMNKLESYIKNKINKFKDAKYYGYY